MARRRFFLALGLVVLYFGGWIALGVATGVADNTEPQYVEGEPQGIHWPLFMVYGLLLGVFVGLAGYAAVRLFRQRGVKFDDLATDEQARREEAARLLHDL